MEAQTLTVWRQADRFSLPRIVYVNKMDRKDGDVHMCCASIEKKLDVPAVLLQLPAVKDGKLFGRYYLFYTWKIKLCFKIINQNQKTWSKECMATMQTLSAVTQFTLIFCICVLKLSL